MRYVKYLIVLLTLVGCTETTPIKTESHINTAPLRRGFAVVICGSDELRHIQATQLAKRTLSGKGFHVLDASTKKSVFEAFEYLARVTGPDDVVWVHFSGHGELGKKAIYPKPPQFGVIRKIQATPTYAPGGKAGSKLFDGRVLAPSELLNLMKKLRLRFGVAIIGGCYSGRHAKKIDRWVVMTSGQEFEQTYGPTFENALYVIMNNSTDSEIGTLFDRAAINARKATPQIVRGTHCSHNVIIPNFRR